jgi:HPt (histidine-containing phosphotransfer) domain-containing protein
VTDIPGEVDAELRVLQEQFALRLPARLSEIEVAWQTAREAGWEAGPLRAFYRLSHSLSGAAATFGFPAVSAAASRLESLLQAMLQQAAAPPEEETARRIEALVDELRSHAPPQDGRGNR